jgi:hypothetical protein
MIASVYNGRNAAFDIFKIFGSSGLDLDYKRMKAIE